MAHRQIGLPVCSSSQDSGVPEKGKTTAPLLDLSSCCVTGKVVHYLLSSPLLLTAQRTISAPAWPDAPTSTVEKLATRWPIEHADIPIQRRRACLAVHAVRCSSAWRRSVGKEEETTTATTFTCDSFCFFVSSLYWSTTARGVSVTFDSFSDPVCY